MKIGQAANAALIAGDEGRYMRGLKSILGTPLLHESRRMLGETITYGDLIARFLVRIRERAEAETGVPIRAVLSGRPVHFHSEDHGRDAQAAADLEACYRAAGFTDVAFLPEPAAAAIAHGGLPGGALGLVVDIGGGTSDFSVFRAGETGVEILANHGVRLGGTNFDKAISVSHVMPLLGHGSEIRKEMGEGTTTAPNSIYQELATWEWIPFLYTPEIRRQVKELAKLAAEPEKLRRLKTVLDLEIGHDVAFAVEAAKIAANGADRSETAIALDLIEPGLAARITTRSLGAALSRHAETIRTTARDCLTMAAVGPADIDAVVYVGGSSLMGVVSDTLSDLLPGAEPVRRNAFTAVAEGLALATAGQG